MPVSRLDVIYRKMLITKFFTKGWGVPDNLMQLFNFRKVVSNRDYCYDLVPPDYPIEITGERNRPDCKIIEGKFWTPFKRYLPEVLVPEVQHVYFQMVLPHQWPDEYKPICIHLAGTGDHYFWRRRNIMAKPLLKKGIGAIILENPYYGLRKPKSQLRSSLHYVSDIFVMGGCLILECIALLNWLEKQNFGPLGISGLSMGGHMASLAASNWPKPLALIPCLSWSTASSVFTEGVMSDSINWEMLQKQFFSNLLYCDTLSKSCKIVDSPFACALSRLPEYGLSNFLDKINIGYITPHEMLNILDNSCRAVTYKHSSTSTKIKSPQLVENSLAMTLFKESSLFSTSAQDVKRRTKEAIWFMRGMMDEFTHLRNYSVPYDPSLIVAVCAKSDGYVPRTGVSTLEEIWPGATIKYVDTGHVGAYIWHRKLFRECILEAFEKAKKVVPPPQGY